MSAVMHDLHQDHRTIHELLGLLARELDAVSDVIGGDFELMRDIMVYMTRYPDHTHHPKEDLMFERMRERGLHRTPRTPSRSCSASTLRLQRRAASSGTF